MRYPNACTKHWGTRSWTAAYTIVRPCDQKRIGRQLLICRVRFYPQLHRYTLGGAQGQQGRLNHSSRNR